MRNINHPLCGCAVFVIQKNHLSTIMRMFKPKYSERKGDFNAIVGKKKDATEQEKDMGEMISHSYDISDRKFIMPIVSYLRE